MVIPSPTMNSRVCAQQRRQQDSQALPSAYTLGGVGAEKHRVLDIVREEGVALERVVMGYCDNLVYEVVLLYELLDRGVYVAFDNFGRELEVVTQSRTSLIAQAIAGIVEKGYLDRILISQDVCYKISLKAYGGFGYTLPLGAIHTWLESPRPDWLLDRYHDD